MDDILYKDFVYITQPVNSSEKKTYSNLTISKG